MKAKEIKNLFIKYSLVLFLIGTVIFLIGFAYNGFKLNRKPLEDYKWYETLVITKNL